MINSSKGRVVATAPDETEPPRELKRVLELPQRTPVDCNKKLEFSSGKLLYPVATQALVEVMTERFALPPGPCQCKENGHPCIKELNAEQAWVLYELAKYEGILGFLPIGTGKTIASILAPLAVPNVKNVVILAKSDQRLHYRRAWTSLREHFRVPTLVMDDNSGHMIGTAGRGMWPVLHFIPYSKLSQPASTRLLADLNPDLIVADEVHCLADMRSARTLRWLRFMATREVKFAGWSGTLIDKSLRNVAHIAAHSLGYGSPMPINPSDVEQWASVMDPSPQPDRTSNVAHAIIRAFGDPNYNPDRDFVGLGLTRVREGYQQRLARTPGVITSKSTSSTASLTIHERRVTMPEAVREALKSVRSWLRPDGEELVESVEQARCAREVASGFYYHWIWRKEDPREKIDEWLNKRKAFNRELREKIMKGEEYLDSRLLCEQAAQRAWMEPPYKGDLPSWKAWNWPAWRDIKNVVEHQQGVKWIDDYLAQDAAAWAKEHVGIVWCLTTAFAREISRISGLPYHGGGPGAEQNILAETGERSIIASIKAHGEGRDGLQFKFSKQLVAELPAGGKTWNQMLGRLNRRGQKADEVQTWVYAHYEEATEALRRAFMQAEFVQEMTDSSSMLLAADFTFEL